MHLGTDCIGFQNDHPRRSFAGIEKLNSLPMRSGCGQFITSTNTSLGSLLLAGDCSCEMLQRAEDAVITQSIGTRAAKRPCPLKFD
jgi:hypothetical protein